jgi:hypothetical protein
MVTKAVDGLDSDCIFYIKEYAIHGAFSRPEPKTMGEQLVSITNKAALARWQHLGIIKCDIQPNHPTPIYYLTDFGKVVAKRILH